MPAVYAELVKGIRPLNSINESNTVSISFTFQLVDKHPVTQLKGHSTKNILLVILLGKGKDQKITAH